MAHVYILGLCVVIPLYSFQNNVEWIIGEVVTFFSSLCGCSLSLQTCYLYRTQNDVFLFWNPINTVACFAPLNSIVIAE